MRYELISDEAKTEFMSQFKTKDDVLYIHTVLEALSQKHEALMLNKDVEISKLQGYIEALEKDKA